MTAAATATADLVFQFQGIEQATDLRRVEQEIEETEGALASLREEMDREPTLADRVRDFFGAFAGAQSMPAELTLANLEDRLRRLRERRDQLLADQPSGAPAAPLFVPAPAAAGDLAEARAKEVAEIRRLAEQQAEERKRFEEDVHRDFLRKTDQRIAAIEFERDLRIRAAEEIFAGRPERLESILEEITAAAEADLRDLGETADETFEGMGEALESGLGDTLTELLLTGENTFDQLGRAFLRLVVNRILTSGIERAFAGLGAGSGAGGTLGTIGRLASLFGLAGAQSGGAVSPGVRVVGELGPELAVFGARSSLVSSADLRRLGQGGGGITVNIVNPPSQPQIQSGTGPNGEQLLEITFSRMFAREVRAGGEGRRALVEEFGVRQRPQGGF